MEFGGNTEEKIEKRDSIEMEVDVEAYEGFHGIKTFFFSRREEVGNCRYDTDCWTRVPTLSGSPERRNKKKNARSTRLCTSVPGLN